jgi:hypothetical protein
MKPNFNAVKTVLIAAATSLSLFSCEKDNDSNDSNVSEAQSLSAASSTAESLYDDAFDVVLQDGETNNVAGRVSSCAVVTLNPADPNVFPKTMTIDFGSGCTSANGITRKGKIIATLTGRIRTTGTTITVSFENYYVNNYKVEGSFSISNNSGGGAGLNFSTQVSNGKITYPDGSTWYSYSGTHAVEQTAGMGTITFTDDNFSMTGGSTTASSAGNSLSVSTTAALVKQAGCKNIVSGIQSFTYNAVSGTLNYGDGTCDNLAVLQVGPTSQTITLPR